MTIIKVYSDYMEDTMTKTYGVIDPIGGTIIAFRADGYRAAKRVLSHIRKRDDLIAPRWMTKEERIKYASCLEWD